MDRICRLTALLLLVFAGVSGHAQTQINGRIVSPPMAFAEGSGAPSGNCNQSMNYGALYFDHTNFVLYTCTTSGWQQASSSATGGATGAASGVLSGTFPSPNFSTAAQALITTRNTYVLEDYLSTADGHSGTDYGYAATNFCNTIGCSTLTQSVGLKTTNSGICKVYTTINIPAPILFDASSCTFVPQSTLGSSYVSLASCSVTIGSSTVTCSNTSGLATGMAVGGDPTIGPENYVASVTNGTTFQLALPASRIFNGMLTVGSPTVKGIDSQIDAASAQTVTGIGIPASTTISSISYANNTWTLSNNATVGAISPISISLASGTVISGLALNAITTTPVILVPPATSAKTKPHGPNYGVLLAHVTIQDPTYSHTSFGRSIFGVQGIQVYGQDNLVIDDVSVNGLAGNALVYGGDIPTNTPDGSNVVREADVFNFYAYSDGDIKTGQACLALMTGLGNGDATQDEINQDSFHNFHCVYPDAEGLVIGSYLHPNSQNGPRLLTFAGNNQFEAGADANYSFGASDMVRILASGVSNKFLGGEWGTPGYGKAAFHISNATDLAMTGLSLGASGGSTETYNVGLTASSPTVTFTSAGTGGGTTFMVGPYWNGIGAQLNDGASCTPCNVWLAPTNAVNGAGTTLTLASNYTGSQTTGTLLIQGGGYYFNLDNTSAVSYLNSIANSYLDQSSPTISLLALGSATNGFLVGSGAVNASVPGLTDHLQSWTLNNIILPPTSYTANSSSRSLNFYPAYLNSSNVYQTGQVTNYASVGTGTNPTVNSNDVCATCNGDFHHITQNNFASGGTFSDLVTSTNNAYFSVNGSSSSAWQMGFKGNASWTLYDKTNSTNAIVVTPSTEAVAFTGPISAPNLTPSVLTSSQSIATTTYTTTGIALPSVAASVTAALHCAIIWEQATAVSTVQFGIANSSVPTQLSVATVMNNTSNNLSINSYVNRTATTASSITNASPPAAINTPYLLQVDGVLQNAATGADVVTIYVETGVGTSAVIIEPGSYCAWVN